MDTDKKPFRVIEEKPACAHCGCGATYTVVYDDYEGNDEVGIGKSWGGPADDEGAREAAEEHAEELNFAFWNSFYVH